YQIYCDFSGYSDIALGAAEVLGFRLMQNFREPYHATSIPDFWKRWHISLSTWFKDYLYIPLAGNRVGYPRWCPNLLICFTLGGLWLGAHWTFVIWGLLPASYMCLSFVTQGPVERLSGLLRSWPKLWRTIQITTTFALVGFAWIFFRAPTVSSALTI